MRQKNQSLEVLQAAHLVWHEMNSLCLVVTGGDEVVLVGYSKSRAISDNPRFGGKGGGGMVCCQVKQVYN